MKLIIDKICYSQVLWLMAAGPAYGRAIATIKIVKGPHFDLEGVNGYIETSIEIDIKNLTAFTALYDSWYKLPDERRLKFYRIALGKES